MRSFTKALIGNRSENAGQLWRRMKRERSAVVLQATWRGRCVRKVTAPTRAARQRELIEMIFMFEEELAAARFLVIEARHKEIECRHQSEELSKMR